MKSKNIPELINEIEAICNEISERHKNVIGKELPFSEKICIRNDLIISRNGLEIAWSEDNPALFKQAIELLNNSIRKIEEL